MNSPVGDLPELPEAVSESIEDKDSGTASTLLAVHRNRLSLRQTGLAELRSHLANESTHLSYLRMAISLVVFGITLNQFSQYLLDQRRFVPDTRPMLRNTEHAGAGMVILGLIVALWSLYRYWSVRQAIRRGRYRTFDVAVAILSLVLIFAAAVTALWIFVP